MAEGTLINERVIVALWMAVEAEPLNPDLRNILADAYAEAGCDVYEAGMRRMAKLGKAAVAYCAGSADNEVRTWDWWMFNGETTSIPASGHISQEEMMRLGVRRQGWRQPRHEHFRRGYMAEFGSRRDAEEVLIEVWAELGWL